GKPNPSVPGLRLYPLRRRRIGGKRPLAHMEKNHQEYQRDVHIQWKRVNVWQHKEPAAMSKRKNQLPEGAHPVRRARTTGSPPRKRPRTVVRSKGTAPGIYLRIISTPQLENCS